MTQSYKKKLIEVAIPLEAINAASAREKSNPFWKGHPRSLHQWWARRPHVTCRTMLFAQLVDDPSSRPDLFPTAEAQDSERSRLFKLMEELSVWENSTNAPLMERARKEIIQSSGHAVPTILDPFAGGGTIPIESQRLGIPTASSDLNPVAVAISAALIDIPPRFVGKKPIHPGPHERGFYERAEGLAEDIRYYSEWLHERCEAQIGQSYFGDTKETEPSETVIAWLWTRTVASPDPAFSQVQVPISSTFALCTKAGREAWLEPIVNRDEKTYVFSVRTGKNKKALDQAKIGTKAGRGANFVCLFSGAAITPEYVKAEGMAGRIQEQLLAVVVSENGRRKYRTPNPDEENHAKLACPEWLPEAEIAPDRRSMFTPLYGLTKFSDLFTKRQAAVLERFFDLCDEVRNEIEVTASKSGYPNDGVSLVDGGTGAKAYAEAISVYLSFALSKLSDYSNSICSWNLTNENVTHLFNKQAIPMAWDFVEVNVFGPLINVPGLAKGISLAVEQLPTSSKGTVLHSNAKNISDRLNNYVINTDPPYYDNIGYADLSDFFYVWLRRGLRGVFPDLFSTLLTPKKEEMVALPYRHASKEAAESFFLSEMSETLHGFTKASDPRYPAVLYYAFKQNEVEKEGISSTGWSVFLQAIIDAGYTVVATWPTRTERAARAIGIGNNALATSVVIVCRTRQDDAEIISRAEFIRLLKRELPIAVAELQAANIAPADMPQSAIGPGMGVFSRFKAVLEAGDSPMTVKTALQLINAELDDYLGGIQGEFDADTRFTITWFEQNGMGKGDYGVADNLARARGISVESVKHAGIVESQASKVRILRRDELLEDWEPQTDTHLTIWECLQYLVRQHEKDGIAYETALLLRKIGDKADAVKDLAYCLYDICANKRQDAKEATAYNALIADWTELTREAASIHDTRGDGQTRMDF